MFDVKEIEAFAERVAREFKPRRIILFGSYAWGRPTESSDVDLLGVLPYVGKSWKLFLCPCLCMPIIP